MAKTAKPIKKLFGPKSVVEKLLASQELAKSNETEQSTQSESSSELASTLQDSPVYEPSAKKSTPAKSGLRKNARAGVIFPVDKILKRLRIGKRAKRMVKPEAAVFVAAVIEYLCVEVLELSGDVAHQAKRLRITPRHLQLAIRTDEELNVVFKDVTISEGGVLPNILPVLLPKPSYKKKDANTTD